MLKKLRNNIDSKYLKHKYDDDDYEIPRNPMYANIIKHKEENDVINTIKQIAIDGSVRVPKKSILKNRNQSRRHSTSKKKGDDTPNAQSNLESDNMSEKANTNQAMEFDKFAQMQDMLDEMSLKQKQQETVIRVSNKYFYRNIQRFWFKWKFSSFDKIQSCYFCELKKHEILHLILISLNTREQRTKDKAFKKWKLINRFRFPCYKKETLGYKFGEIISIANKAIWEKRWNPKDKSAIKMTSIKKKKFQILPQKERNKTRYVTYIDLAIVFERVLQNIQEKVIRPTKIEFINRLKMFLDFEKFIISNGKITIIKILRVNQKNHKQKPIDSIGGREVVSNLNYIFSKDAIEQLCWKPGKDDISNYKDFYINRMYLQNNSDIPWLKKNKSQKDQIMTGTWANQFPLFRFREEMYFKFQKTWQKRATGYVLRILREFNKRKLFKQLLNNRVSYLKNTFNSAWSKILFKLYLDHAVKRYLYDGLKLLIANNKVKKIKLHKKSLDKMVKKAYANENKKGEKSTDPKKDQREQLDNLGKTLGKKLELLFGIFPRAFLNRVLDHTADHKKIKGNVKGLIDDCLLFLFCNNADLPS